MNIVSLFAYCLGGALFKAVIFFPLTFVAMRSQYRFRGSLSQAWGPFGYSIIILAVAQLCEISLKNSNPDDTNMTLMGLMSGLLIPILVCAIVLYFTYRDPHAPPPLPE
jgi:hypothetical protein